MQYLNTFLNLLAKTESRDKILRFFQYATIHSEEHHPPGATYNVYLQIRRTRRWLRFFRTIELIVKIRKDFSELKKVNSFGSNLVKFLGIFQSISTLFFYLFDHQVVLGQLQLVRKQQVAIFQPKSMKAYLLQNVLGALKNILQILLLIHEGKVDIQSNEEQNQKKGMQQIKSKTIEFFRNILDIMVACYYINKPKNAAIRIGIVGMVTSLVGIAQSLKII